MATPKMATAGPLDKGQPSDYMRDQAQRNYNRPDFRTVAAAALASVDSVLAHWLPDGKRTGHEYAARNPTRSDNRPGSFSINVNNGKWSDFATGDAGGDLVSLVAYLEGCDQGEAADRLADYLGLPGARPASFRGKPNT